MKTLAFIVEYNPFHYGHKYHLEESLSLTRASHSIALMSGSFLQRGEPALVDKWTRAKMAIDNGVDLVLELPFVYSCQSAEFFAQGAVKTLNSLNLVDCLSFGSELGSLEPLEIISDILIKEPMIYKSSLKDYLSSGLSFANSRSRALLAVLKKNSLLKEYPYEEILKGSNNILAIEYLKSIKKLQSKIRPVTIKRLGADYKDKNIKNNLASATGIRQILFEEGIGAIDDLVPSESLTLIKEFYSKYHIFNSLDKYESIIRYLLLSKNSDFVRSILDVETGLENRIYKKAMIEEDIEGIVNSIASKRYPSTRIQRILIHLLTGLDKSTVKRFYGYEPQYVRLLAANSKGREILSHIKETSDINIISKYSNYRRLNNPIINEFLYFEEKATDIYFWGLNKIPLEVRKDYYTSPYIARK